MVVVSDTSIITNLYQINQLHLLHFLYNEIIIPKEVYAELSVIIQQKNHIDSLTWITIKEALNKSQVNRLMLIVDAGEAEAISLAIEMNANFLLIDESRGRKVATQNGLKIAGILGILTSSKKEGYITSVKSLIDVLINKVGFRINPKLYQQVLAQVNELNL